MNLNEGSIIDTIVDLIVKGRVKRLEKAFQQSPTLVQHIKDYWTAHERFRKGMEDWCKKYPESCKGKNFS